MKLNHIPGLVILCFLIPICLAGCGSKRAFLNEIELMNDDELLSYYQGINDNIRDIDRGMRVDDHLGNQKHSGEGVNWRSSFFFLGEGYQLNNKKNLIEKELIKRNIRP